MKILNRLKQINIILDLLAQLNTLIDSNCSGAWSILKNNYSERNKNLDFQKIKL